MTSKRTAAVPKRTAAVTAEGQESIRVGISSCLLGENVRYDGGHKEDRFITQTLSQYFEYVPVCPELEVGMGVPREAIRLVGDPESPRLLGVRSAIDHTLGMQRFAARRVRELAALDLDGYIFKKDSPSCGTMRVRVYDEESGIAARKGVGMFARAFMAEFPLIPVEEEGRLSDPVLRENFIVRVFCHQRWRLLRRGGVTRGRLVAFHTAHKLLVLAHSPRHYQDLGRLVAAAKSHRPAELAERYGKLLLAALALKATPRKHANVLQHIAGYFKRELTAGEKEELQGVIDDYRRGLVPLIVPITLVQHYVRRLKIDYLAGQVYLNPHPKELMLRNHV
jgi:uncharacterized protein YbgA (DUF1722 family)/uncharacterized protein YbbK (DUF523 family)